MCQGYRHLGLEERIEIQMGLEAGLSMGAVAARPAGHPLEIGEELAVPVRFRLDKRRLRALDSLATQRGTRVGSCLVGFRR